MALLSQPKRELLAGDHLPQDEMPMDESAHHVGDVLNVSSVSAAKMPRLSAPGVAELSARLYSAYTVESGGVQLAGCTLELEPIVHVVQKSTTATDLFLTPQGEPLDAATIENLGLNDLTILHKPPRITDDELARLLELGRNSARRSSGNELPDAVEIEIVWCRFAAGKLRFTIGELSTELPFSGWAARLTPPPFVCSHSGKSTYILAATDDGRIVAADEIAPCQESSKRILRGELVTCSATGKQVDPGLTEICPATQLPVLRSRMVECPTCRSRVSPQAIARDRCKLCREPPTMIKTDSRITPIFSAHPGLNRWHHWKMATTPGTFMLEATSLLRQLLIVLDRQSLMPLRVATKTRLQRTWTDLPRSNWPEQLR